MRIEVNRGDVITTYEDVTCFTYTNANILFISQYGKCTVEDCNNCMWYIYMERDGEDEEEIDE